MKGKILPNAGDQIEIDIPESGTIEIYRDPERQNEVVANNTGDSEDPVGLGIYDPSVSRRGTEDNPKYVAVFRENEEVFVTDTGQLEDVVLEDLFETLTLTEGEQYAIHQDAKLHFGYDTTIGIDVSQDRGEVSILYRINQTKKWVRRGTNREALREAEGLLDQLRTATGESDTDVSEEVQGEFENVVTQLRNQIDTVRDDGDKPVPKQVREKGLRVLDRLEQHYME